MTIKCTQAIYSKTVTIEIDTAFISSDIEPFNKAYLDARPLPKTFVIKIHKLVVAVGSTAIQILGELHDYADKIGAEVIIECGAKVQQILEVQHIIEQGMCKSRPAT